MADQNPPMDDLQEAEKPQVKKKKPQVKQSVTPKKGKKVKKATEPDATGDVANKVNQETEKPIEKSITFTFNNFAKK